MEHQIWDVIVIGGGPAGMMAAGRAAENGCLVLLLEKNPTLGKKLLITGGGRCNVTNNKPDIHVMLAQYKKSQKFLYSTFSQFGVTEAIHFFTSRGMPIKEEAEGRLFPQSNTAQSVWEVMVQYIEEQKVVVKTNSAVKAISFNKDTDLFTLQLTNSTALISRACIVATGGSSRPETGSTGEGFKWLKKLGHTIKENDMALVPIALHDEWAKKLAGLTFTDIKLIVFQNNERQSVHKGKILFTHFGISGPTVLNMSKEIGEHLQYGEVKIELDLYPKTDHGALREQLTTVLAEESNKKLKNSLPILFPKSLVPALLELCEIDGETPGHSVRKEDRIKLIQLVKALPLRVKNLLGADKAVVSSGGVCLKEVDFKTMQSRIVPGLFLVGDVLNIDRPSGGYSLQLCWTTGMVAGASQSPKL